MFIEKITGSNGGQFKIASDPAARRVNPRRALAPLGCPVYFKVGEDMEPQVELTEIQGYGKNVTVLSSKIRFTEDYEKQVKIFLYDDGGMMFESDSGMSVFLEKTEMDGGER